MQDTILIVEDEKDLLDGLKRIVTMELNCRVLVAEDAFQAMAELKKNAVDLVLTDICMPEMDGIALLRNVAGYDPSITVVMMTGYGTIESAVECIKAGAYDFIQKPFDDLQLMHLLKKGLERNRLLRENTQLMRKVREKSPFENLVGKGPKMQKIFQTIQMLAQTEVTVLILGETGTGKDLAAQAIHNASNRRQKPMVTVNCPALPESILESELFGYRKGAFTDAHTDKKGLFDQAAGSTIFLDEIGDLPLPVQTKLLRVLQGKEIRPLGQSHSHHVDVRIIAATNQRLKQKMQEERFRPDLYYRLHVATLMMPPLRDITEEIPLLVKHFLEKSAIEMNIPPKTIEAEALEYLMSKNWPGNVRELENTILGWASVTPGNQITLANLPSTSRHRKYPDPEFDVLKPYLELKDNAIEDFTLNYLYRLLEHTKGNMTQSARISGIKRQSLQKIVKRYGVQVERFRT